MEARLVYTVEQIFSRGPRIERDASGAPLGPASGCRTWARTIEKLAALVPRWAVLFCCDLKWPQSKVSRRGMFRVSNPLERSTLTRECFLLFVCFCGGSRFGLCQTAQVSPPSGEALFQERCVKCHGDKGQGVSALVTIAGPPLIAVHDRGLVLTAMEVGPGHMPKFADVLSVDEMQAIAGYVTQTLAVMPLQGGDIGQGGELFRNNCAPCHRTAVRGGALAFAGTNAPPLTNVSPAIIAGTIRRAPGPMPSFPPSVLTDEQVASIVEYVKFVQHPPSPGGSPLNWYGPVAEGFVAWVAMFALIAVTGWIEKGEEG